MESENKFLIPLSIIVAAVLIGGAVYFKGKTSPATPGDDTLPADIVVAPLSADDHVLGSPNAPITVVTFSDIDCPFCKTFDITMRRIMDEYGESGKVAWVFRQFPLDQLHPDARVKAESSECVAKLGGNEAFWSYMEKLFVSEDETPATLATIAAQVGVDTAAFQACVDAETYAQDVVDDVEAALAAGGRGTPYTIVIGPAGEKVPVNGAQPYDVVKQVIDTLLLSPGAI